MTRQHYTSYYQSTDSAEQLS